MKDTEEFELQQSKVIEVFKSCFLGTIREVSKSETIER
jgi:hypothetical protein